MSIFIRKIKLKSKEQAVPIDKKESPLSYFLKKYSKALIFLVTVVIVTLVSIQGFCYYRKNKIETLSDKIYFTFKSRNTSASEGNSKGLADLSALLNGSDSSTMMAEQALLAGLYGEEKKYNEAYDIFAGIYKKTDNPFLKILGAIGTGYSLEGKGEFDKALTQFNEVLNLKPSEEFKYLADTSIARCQEQKGNTAEALKLYKKIIETYSNLADKQFIEFKINRLSS